MSVRGRDALGCGLISPQKRAQEVSILGAEKAHGKWCIESDSRRSKRRRTAALLTVLLPRERMVERLGNRTVNEMRALYIHSAIIVTHDCPMGRPWKAGTSA